MQKFSAFQYIKLDIANSFGLDKDLFEERLGWFEQNKMQLASLVDSADEPAQFYAGTLAYEDTKAGKPTGYLVGMDATASGLQCMAALTGCKVTAMSVNMVDPDCRKDVYTDGYKVMINLLDGKMDKFERADTKDATMTHFYGSQANPRNLFGENSIELQKFYEMVNIVAPGANMLRQDLIDIWQPYALEHRWVLPDGFTAVVKVMSMVEESFEVNELNSSFTHRYWINKGTATGLSLAANVIHSVDGFVVREMNRRANYDVDMIKRVYSALTRGTSYVYIKDEDVHAEKLKRLVGLAEAHKMVSVVLAEHITHENVDMVPLWIKRELIRIIEQMLNHKPFALIAIHQWWI